MRKYTQKLENIMDNLREEGCPESELEETAQMFLDEEKAYRKHSSYGENPFWEPLPSSMDYEEIFDPMSKPAPPSYNYELGAFTGCYFA